MIWWGVIGVWVSATLREVLLDVVEPKYTLTVHFDSAHQALPTDYTLPIHFQGLDFKCYFPWQQHASNDTNLIKGPLSPETAYYLTSSLEGKSLVMDKGEWWIYELRIGAYFRQFHYDRPGMIQKADDPVPGQIMLGKWKETRRAYPKELYSLQALPLQVTLIGMVAIFSKPQVTSGKYGLITGWGIKVNGQKVELVYKVDDYFFLLRTAVATPLFRVPYSVIERREPPIQSPTHYFYRNYFTCQDCHFTGILSPSDTLIFVHLT